MKKLIFIILISLTVFPASAQELFQKLVDKYSDTEGFSAVQLSKDMFDLYLKKKNISENDPIYDVIKNLENILVITQNQDKDKSAELKSIQTEIIDYYKKAGLSLFKTEKKENNDLKIFIKKTAENVSTLGVVNLSDYSLTLIEINGKIDLASISNLNKAFNIRGLEALRQIDESSSPFYSPNFVFGASGQSLKMSEEDRKKMMEDIKKAQEGFKFSQEQFKFNEKEWQEQMKKFQLSQKDFFEQYRRTPIFLGENMGNARYFIDGKEVDKDALRELDSSKIESVNITKNPQREGKPDVKIVLKK